MKLKTPDELIRDRFKLSAFRSKMLSLCYGNEGNRFNRFSHKDAGSVAYAENFHGGFHSVAYDGLCIWCALFLTSQFNVIFTFPNQRFGEVC